MQELHCRPLFQAIPLNARVNPLCKKPIETGIEAVSFKDELHKKTKNKHDSLDLWSMIDEQNFKHKKPQEIINSDFLKFTKSKLLGILGISLMGLTLSLSVMKSFFPKDDD